MVTRVRFSILVKDLQDGSVSTLLYPNRATAERAAENRDPRFEDDVQDHELVIDLKTGKIVSGLKGEEDAEDA